MNMIQLPYSIYSIKDVCDTRRITCCSFKPHDEPEMLVYKPYFADEKTKAQKDEVTCPSHKAGWLGDG